MSANTPEPPPTPVEGPAVWDLVQEDMRERDKLGAEKYGVRLTANDGRCSMVDAYQEVLDLAVYMRKHIEEVDQLRAQLAEVEKDRDQARLYAGIWERRVVEAAEYGEVLEAELVDVARSRDGWKAQAEGLAESSKSLEKAMAAELDRTAR